MPLHLPVRPWWEEMNLREEVADSGGLIDDVQMSLHNAVFGRADGSTVDYHKAAYYGEITHPAGSLVALMAQIAVRLGAPGSVKAKAVWRLDQAMGGGKSHGLIGLWHLARHTAELAGTDLGEQVLAEARRIAGADALTDGLNDPVCVVLDCDNPAPREQADGPAKTLGERFLWRLFNRDYPAWEAHKGHTSSKAELARALASSDRPVLILIDEIMDYLRWASNQSEQLALDDMAFLRALLDTVNDVDNCALVVVMIASDKDNITLNELGARCRAELEDLLLRNGEATTVTSGGDFADIIRRRLFENAPAATVAAATAALCAERMGGPWSDKVFGAIDSGFSEQVARCYPFHPALLDLADQEWSLHAGFQKVRSTIRVFAATAHSLIGRARRDEWVPLLIGPGDLPLSDRPVRDSLLDSGLVADTRTQSSLREVALAEIVDPDHDDRGTAWLIDRRAAAEGVRAENPRAAERMAAALFLYSLCPRPKGRRGATEPELHAAAFVPVNAYGPGDSEIVMRDLFESGDGLVAFDKTPGSGRNPARYHFETRKTLPMLHRAERQAVGDADRDEAVAEIAFDLRVTGPFQRVVEVRAENAPTGPVTADDLRGLLAGAGIDQQRQTRLVILDSRWFSLLNGDDSATRTAVESAMGLGRDRLAVGWASSAVFACANTQLRSHARRIATDYLAWKRVSSLDAVRSDDDMAPQAREQLNESKKRLHRAVKDSYQHVFFLSEDSTVGQTARDIRLQKENQSALDGSVVWAALTEEAKAFGSGQLTAGALVFNLGDGHMGRPLSEIRDSFWNTPRLPLLPGGEPELRRAIYAAVADGKLELVDEGGNVIRAEREADINLANTGIRVREPRPEGSVDQVGPVTVPDLAGKPLAAARVELQTLGLTANLPETDGNVATQSLQPGEQVSAGTPVTLEVVEAPSSGEQQVTISTFTSLRDDEGRREDVVALLRTITNAVDSGKATYVGLQMQIAANPESAAKIAQAAETAGVNFNIT